MSNTLDAEGIKIDYLITCPAPDTDSTGAFSYNSHAVTNSLEWENNFKQNLLAAAIFCDIFGAKMSWIIACHKLMIWSSPDPGTSSTRLQVARSRPWQPPE